MIQRNPHKGFFLTFEGVEGTGKSTHAATLGERLKVEGYSVVQTREPGGTPLGEAVRDMVLRSHQPGGEAELFLILASRADHVEQVLVPALNEGRVVICDRFSHASLAYQGGGRGLSRDHVEQADALATGGLRPDLTLLLDAEPKALSDRLARRASREGLDRIDREQRAFFERVRGAYFELARDASRKMVVVPTDDPREHVLESIWDIVRPAVEARRKEGALR